MLTVNALRAWGANVDEALVRCLNNENFYVMLVGKAIQDPAFEKLPEAVAAKELDKAFELAHALKGVMANLALTPITEPVSEMTELLRSGTDTDYTPYVETIREKRRELIQLSDV